MQVFLPPSSISVTTNTKASVSQLQKLQTPFFFDEKPPFESFHNGSLQLLHLLLLRLLRRMLLLQLRPLNAPETSPRRRTAKPSMLLPTKPRASRVASWAGGSDTFQAQAWDC